MNRSSTEPLHRQRSNIVYSPLPSMGDSLAESGTQDHWDTAIDPSSVLLDCGWKDRKETVTEDERTSSHVSMTSNHSSSRRQESAFARARCHKKKLKKYGLANDSSSHSSSHTPPPLLRASSSSDSTTGEDVRHYSVAATERLFGGPLQFMYRARRWQPFTDPHVIFQRVFHSSLPPVVSHDTTPTQPLHMELSAPATLRSETETLPDGTVIHRNSKCLHRHRTLVRTVTRYPDPSTGVMRTRIQVTAHDPLQQHAPCSLPCKEN